MQVPLHVRPGALHVRRGALHDTCAAVPFTRAPRCPSRGTCTRLYTVHSSQRRNPQQFRTLSELTQEPSAPSPPLVWPGRLVTPASCHSARSAPPPAVTRGRFSTPSQPSRRKPNQSQLSPQPSRRNPNHIRSALFLLTYPSPRGRQPSQLSRPEPKKRLPCPRYKVRCSAAPLCSRSQPRTPGTIAHSQDHRCGLLRGRRGPRPLRHLWRDWDERQLVHRWVLQRSFWLVLTQGQW